MGVPYRAQVRINKCNELQADLEIACMDYGGQFYLETLEEWTETLKSINRSWEYHQRKLPETQRRWIDTELRLPNVSDDDFDRFCMLGDLLARLKE